MSDAERGAGRAILAAIEAMEKRLMERLDRIGTVRTAATASSDAAPDSDLDGQYGNPEVKKNPPRWVGTDHVGRTLSQCEPAFLDEMASFHDWRVTKAEDDKKAGYARKDAARARGWAARLRAGWKPPGSEAPPDDVGWGDEPPLNAPADVDVPF
jgi:propanediol dehydratase small subunit